MNIRTRLLASIALAVAAPVAALAAEQSTPMNPAIASLITELELREAPRPVRETRGWRKPQRIVVRAESPDRLAAFGRLPRASISSPRRTRPRRWRSSPTPTP